MPDRDAERRAREDADAFAGKWECEDRDQRALSDALYPLLLSAERRGAREAYERMADDMKRRGDEAWDRARAPGPRDDEADRLDRIRSRVFRCEALRLRALAAEAGQGEG